MKHIFVAFLFFICSNIYSQSNSIIKVDSVYLKRISKKSSVFRKQKNLDSAIFYADKLLSNSRSINDTSYILKSYKKLAQYHRLNNSPFKSVKFYNKSKELSLELNDTTSALKALRYIAFIQKELGDFNGSEITAIEALGLIENSNDSINRLALLNQLGIITQKQKNYDDALDWYQAALEITTDSIKIVTIKYNIAVVYQKKGNYKKSIKNFNKIANLSILKEKPYLKLKIYDNLAFSKSKLNNSNAEKELKQVLNEREKLNDLNGQFPSTIHLTQHYQDRKENNKALFYAKRAYSLSKSIKSTEAKTEALSYLIQLEDNPKETANEYRNLTDSIFDARQRTKNQFAKIKYKTEEGQKRILELKAETAEKDLKLTQETSKRNILFLTTSILLVSIFFIMYHWRQRIKIARINERHQTNTRLSKKLHDEVGNDLYYLLLQLQKITGFSNNHENLKILQGFDTVYHKIRDFSRDNKVETGEEYGDELLSLLDSYGDSNTKVITSELEPEFWSNVATIKKEELYWVLKELLTNMKKHSNASIVAITFTKNKKDIIVHYTDNGIGINLDRSNSKNGILNVENRMKDIGGTIIFDSKPKEGFKATIVFAP